jgi:hypothetical protein
MSFCVGHNHGCFPLRNGVKLIVVPKPVPPRSAMNSIASWKLPLRPRRQRKLRLSHSGAAPVVSFATEGDGSRSDPISAWFALAKWLRRTFDWHRATQVPGPEADLRVNHTCGEFFLLTRHITLRCARTWRYRRMCRSIEQSNTPVSASPSPSWRIINMCGYDFRERTSEIDSKERMPSSRVLKELLDQAPADYFTLRWLTVTLRQRSFGIITLCLGLLATVPVGSTVPGLMLVALAVQMIVGRGEPIVPNFIAVRRLPTRHLLRLGRRAIPVLKYLEKAVHPRWPATFEVAKRVVGVMVLLLTAVLLLTPVPLSNIAPAMVIALISLAYIEEDGLLLSVALLAGTVLIGVMSAAVWGTIVGAVLISKIW